MTGVDVVAAVEDLLRDGTPTAVAEALAVGRATDALATADVAALAGRFLVAGHHDLARDLVDEVDRRGTDDLTGRERRRLDHLRSWTHAARLPDPPADAVPLGIFYYRQPHAGRSSSNIGDYVQTLSMLGNVARFTDVELSGPDGLGELGARLQSRVRPELRVTSPARKVHLVPVSRDFSHGDQIPDGTWLLAFGWHLHASYGIRYGLPFDPRLRPLFVSFHLHAIDALDAPTIEHLRAHGPIGCRDWTTVDLLLSAGVDAFFTGCVTTTVDAVFQPLDAVDRSGADALGIIDIADPDDLAPDQPVARIANGDRAYRKLTLVSGTLAAIDALEDYQRRLARVVTTRLHSYLPATSLGLEVDVRPKIPGDARFTGLLGLRPGSPELEAMRGGIRELVADALGRIVAGEPVDAVYAAWRARTAPLVEQARARLHAPAPDLPAPATDATRRRLEELAPTPVDGPAGRTAVWTLPTGAVAADVLALPALLPEVDRVVLLPAGEPLAEAELARLAQVDLRGHPAAARVTARAAAWVWRVASHRLPPDDAAELRRLMSARHPFATREIEPGPLVLDLALMRRDEELADCLALAARFGLDAREGLLAYAGPRVAPLPRGDMA